MVKNLKTNYQSSIILNNRILIAILALTSFLLYSNTISHNYAYDDFSVLKNNAVVTKGISGIPEILTTPYRSGFYKTTNDMYRPLSQVMFAIEYELFNDDPSKSHLINVLLYAACAILLFVFLDVLFDRKKTTVIFIATLLFVLHPVHTEVVANIKSRDELLCFLWAMSSMYIYTQYADKGRYLHLIIASVLFFLSLLSKETSITFVAIIPLTFFLFKNDNKKRNVFITASAIIVASVFLVIRFLVLSSSNAGDIADVPMADNFLTMAPSTGSGYATKILILGKYLKILFWPYPLISDYSYNSIPFVGFDNIWVWVVLLCYVSLLGVAIYRVMKFPKDTLAYGILFYMVTISLFSNILFLTGAAMAERFLFFPSVGFCIVIAALIERYVAYNAKQEQVSLFDKKMLLLILPISVCFSVVTVARNKDWADNMTLFQSDAKSSPDNIKLNYFLANELLRSSHSGSMNVKEQQDAQLQAMRLLRRSLDIYPGYADAKRALGNAYFLQGAYDSAKFYLEEVIKVNPNDFDALSNLDVVYYHAQEFQNSIDVCKQILVLYPGAVGKYKNIATCFTHIGQPDSALKYERLYRQYSVK